MAQKTWEGALLDILAFLPKTFTLEDVYFYIPSLLQSRSNNFPAEKVRQTLQSLVAKGEIIREERGVYSQSSRYNWPIDDGERLPKKEVAKRLGVDESWLLRYGIVKPKLGPYSRDLLVFCTEAGGEYENTVLADGTILQVGQGLPQNGDQTMTSYNRYLAQHLELGLRVRGFTRKQSDGEFQYRGQYTLNSVRSIAEQSRSAFLFELVPINPASAGEEFSKIYREQPVARVEYRPQEKVVQNRAVREAGFRQFILSLYHKKCAVCGVPIEVANRIDLQAAHVRAVASGGLEDANNGMSLCARHHWCFDNGVFTVSPDYNLLLAGDFVDPHDEIMAGHEILLPDAKINRPHPDHLRWHRHAHRIQVR